MAAITQQLSLAAYIDASNALSMLHILWLTSISISIEKVKSKTKLIRGNSACTGNVKDFTVSSDHS